MALFWDTFPQTNVEPDKGFFVDGCLLKGCLHASLEEGKQLPSETAKRGLGAYSLSLIAHGTHVLERFTLESRQRAYPSQPN